MRYRNLAPKYLYVMGLMLNMVILIFLTFIYTKVIESGEMVAILLVGGIVMFNLLYTGTYLNKCIYLRIDIDNNKILYGNIWFSQEALFENLQGLKKVSFFSNLYRVNLGGKNFYFFAAPTEKHYLNDVLKSN